MSANESSGLNFNESLLEIKNGSDDQEVCTLDQPKRKNGILNDGISRAKFGGGLLVYIPA